MNSKIFGPSKMINEKRLKQEAKLLKKNNDSLNQAQALNIVARKYGYSSWPDVSKELKKQEIEGIPIPSISTNFVEYNEVEMSEKDYEVYDQERASDLQLDQKLLLRSNTVALTKLGVEFSLFEPTQTGLNKSILDATQSVRDHFELEEFHYYFEQEQGVIRKEVSYLVNQNEIKEIVGSFYRPKTKQGDPRMWYRQLPKFATAGDQIAIVIYQGAPHLINLSQVNLENELQNPYSQIYKLIKSYINKEFSYSAELLDKIKELAKQPFKAQRSGDTAIGYTLEALLGIDANSSKDPDYHGIEIKSGRGGKNRTTLFAQVADWNLSPCGCKEVDFTKGSSAKILDRYGYEREDDFKLYCTVSTQRQNTQGLHFIFNKQKDQLEEWYRNEELVAVWPAKLLKKRLVEKHSETFWVQAKSFKKSGEEFFQLEKVVHTKAPVLSQLIPLICSGVITMDHLIKRSGKTGRVTEKGPLFKIDKRNLELLFPEPVDIIL